MNFEIQLPNSINTDHLNKLFVLFEENHANIINSEKIIFNFSRCSFISPAGSVALATDFLVCLTLFNRLDSGCIIIKIFPNEIN